MNHLLRSPVIAAVLFVIGAAILQLAPAQSTLYKWSQTAGSNGNSDSTINWSEGMAPSAVNDSARAMMAAIAKWRDDTNGSLTTGGTSTAYTLTSNQVFSSLALMDGQTIRARIGTTNGASPTLNVDGLGAKNIVRVSGTAIPTGVLIANGIYEFTYKNSTTEWTVSGGTFAEFATGTKMPFWQAACPAGWTKDSTAAIDNAAMIGTTSSGGGTGGSTAFTSVMTSRTIAQANLPSVNFTVSASGTITSANWTNGVPKAITQTGGVPSGAFSFNGFKESGSGDTDINGGAVSISGTAASGGSGTALDFASKYITLIVCTRD